MKSYIERTTPETITNAKELIIEILKENRGRQLTIVEIRERIDNRIGMVITRGVLWMLVGEGIVRLRRFASNRMTYQLQ